MNSLTLDQDTLLKPALNDLILIRQQSPIIHNLTNLVVMQTTANLLLAIGASPIMAHAKEELSEIIQIAQALVINIGTLDEEWINAIEKAQFAALQQRIPIIFDPVGAGASHYRTSTAKQILKRGINILRGNATEILSLTDATINTKGIDSQHTSKEALIAGKQLAQQYHCTVVISGRVDVIIDQDQEVHIPYGTPLFTKVTGMGCGATAIIGAFAAVNKNYFKAAIHAMTLYTLAGELAAANAKGPGTFATALLDALFSLNTESL
jgi:hydroxyethylthiazole kinase